MLTIAEWCTYAILLILQDGRKEVLADAFGERSTPALVTYLDDDIVRYLQ